MIKKILDIICKFHSNNSGQWYICTLNAGSVTMSYFGKGKILFVVVVLLVLSAVSGWVTEHLLKLPSEVGEIWISSVQRIHLKLFNFISTYADVYSYKVYIFVILGSILGYYFYGLLFRPLNRVRLFGDIGYLPDGKFTLKDIANDVKRRRVAGEVPPVYPNGWFGLMEGFKLQRGEAKSISVLGKSVDK